MRNFLPFHVVAEGISPARHGAWLEADTSTAGTTFRLRFGRNDLAG